MIEKSDEELPQRADLLRFIIESATHFAIFTVDEAGSVTTWNSGAERLFGYREHQIVGYSGDVIFTPEDRAAGVPQKERSEAAQKGRAVDERWHQRPDGSRFWASGLLMPLHPPLKGFVKIAQDKTDEHEATVRLRESEERFRLLATSIPQLVFRTLPDGTRTWGSPQWIDFTGLGLEESLDHGWLDAIHPEDRQQTRDAWSSSRRSGEYYVEHRVRHRESGEYRWFQTRARPVQRERSTPGDWIGTMTDIHELRLLQGRQQVMMAELHHRTRNLLAVVQAIAMQLERSASTKKDFLDAFLQRLGALSRAQGLIARAQQGQFLLSDLVETEITAHVSGPLEEARVRIEGPEVFLPVLSMQALALALHELATNAIKYGALSNRNGQLQVSWKEISKVGAPVVLFEWKETGVAIDQAPQHRGYGSTLIENALPRQPQTRTGLVMEGDGVRCWIELPASAVQAA
ncbi:PAS domain S-box protein [Aestuariivirga sp.]|uniref:PAS domain S-box protein n=1 Tax=Aestuariivirga sp. TaxID=2650926 RepID=UPI003BAC29EC